MSKRSTPVLIGDLLVKSELVSLGQFADAMPISLKTGLPVGRVLVGSGFLTEPEFKAAVTAQSLVRENLLPMEMAINSLRLARQQRLTFDEALRQIGWRSEYYEATNRLGDLIVDAGCMKASDLEGALDACFTSGLPLGRVLVLRGVCNEMLTYAALTAQVLLREGNITREQALEGLKIVNQRKITMEESLDQQGLIAKRGHTIRLGELLMLASLVSEIDLLSAVERGMLDEQPIGQVLVRVGLITEQTLEQALQLQNLVTRAQLRPLDAAEVLKKVRKTGVSIEKAIAELSGSGASGNGFDVMEMPELLRAAGLLAHTDMIKSIDQSSATGVPVEQVLMNSHLVDQVTMDAASRCQALLKAGQISQEQCVFALQTWIGSRRDIDQILSGVGWKPAQSKL
ncbi:hypothetical protein KF707_17785 [Candidatus Obscuribacterales bacterium]|nr:hypothetical protein [Candidatus Obscuribacterales bacterium]MBX3138083.1 hypothetical protein [Candidatus Obscuribacterales bacterium]